jgi:hypothetical protein
LSTEKERLAKLKAMTHKGSGLWVCPICGGKYADSDWRRADPERMTCQNGHKKVKLVFYSSFADYGYDKHVKQNPKVKEIDW